MLTDLSQHFIYHCSDHNYVTVTVRVGWGLRRGLMVKVKDRGKGRNRGMVTATFMVTV